ncbi:MAG: hypothetical protein KDA77_09845, partial [Planctomycetaceae bacterium]|nr:hypothetical protein [Planctomycetaceae bacterium]
MKQLFSHSLLFSVAACFIVGCGNATTTPETNSSTETTTTEPAVTTNVLLTSEPAGAKEVIDARKSAKNDEEVILVGR